MMYDKYLFSVMSAAFLIAAGGLDAAISRMDDAGKIKAMVGKVSAVIATENRQVVERRNIEVPAGIFDSPVQGYQRGCGECIDT